jgi:hypothetical protein
MVLTKFAEALELHKGEINPTQYWRYKGGRLPRLLLWLAKNPELAEALAADARALAGSERAIVSQERG